MTIREELLQLIWLNDGEDFVPTHIALGQLDERFADDLIPGLMECLTDEDPEIRRLAVELLVEAKANVAVPALIERLSDNDRLVQVAVIGGIGEFGPLASDAIIPLHPWLDSENEYLRILAATAVMSIDEYRTELLYDIRQALKSADANVQGVARDFFSKTKATMPFDEDAFKDAVRSNWNFHAPCEQVEWRCELLDNGAWEITVSPVYQQVWAGEDDGRVVWAGFDFHGFGFLQEPGVELLDFGAMSFCLDHNPTPFIGFKGRYFGQPFILHIHLEPSAASPIREVLDTVTKQVRPIDAEDETAP
ncbi:MAG: HEAT repeat domain-containing protein [Pirellulales bacterium]